MTPTKLPKSSSNEQASEIIGLFGIERIVYALFLLNHTRRKEQRMSDTTTSTAIVITDESFNQLTNSDAPTLVDFWAPWCGPCKALVPTIDELAQDLAGKAHVGKVNVDDYPSLAAQFGVSSIPAVMIFKNGKVIETLVGLRPKEAYIKALGF